MRHGIGQHSPTERRAGAKVQVHGDAKGTAGQEDQYRVAQSPRVAAQGASADDAQQREDERRRYSQRRREDSIAPAKRGLPVGVLRDVGQLQPGGRATWPQAGDIVLPADPAQVIRVTDNPALKEQIGNDIVTSDGTTLLGADNKAGVAEIMDAAQFLIDNPQLKHGTIKILFTPDEEIGRGVDKVDIKKLGAEFGYTIDGESAGHLEDETFSADGATVTITGVSAHPGFAKGRMEHAIKIASRIVERLPQDTCSPETTEGKEGFLHPIGISGSLESAKLDFIVRDFTDAGLREKETLLENIVKDVMQDFPHSSYTIAIKQQYRNMKQVIDRHPDVVDNALEAIRRAGLQPMRSSIRGGTDGSRLSFMGLPCPNIFAGEHAFHSRLEWVSRQDMEKAAETIVHLAMIWEERA